MAGGDTMTGRDALRDEIDKWDTALGENIKKAAKVRAEVRGLRRRLGIFSGEYYSRVGSWYARLDVVGIELDMYRHRLSRVTGAAGESTDEFSGIEDEVQSKFRKIHDEAKKRLDSADEIGRQYRRDQSREELLELLSEEKQEKILGLFEKLALLFLSDKADTDGERIEFNAVMAEIGKAYAGTRLDLPRRSPGKAKQSSFLLSRNDPENPARLKKLFSAFDLLIKEEENRRDEIRSSCLWKLMLRVEEARLQGEDLLAEMTRRAKNELTLRQEILDALVKEYRDEANGILEQVVRIKCVKNSAPVLLDGDDALYQELLAGALAARGMDEAARLRSADELVDQGLVAWDKRQYRRALDLFEKALCADPDHCRALFFAGFGLQPIRECGAVIDELYGRRWRVAVRRSIELYQRLIGIIRDGGSNPAKVDESTCLVNLGLGHMLLSNEDEAMACWQKSTELDNDAVAWSNIGFTHLFNNRFDEAIAALIKSISSDPTRAVPYFLLGRIRKDANEKEKALDCFKTYLRYVDKDDPWEAENIRFAQDHIASGAR